MSWAISYGLQGWWADYEGLDQTQFAPMYTYSQDHDESGDDGSYPVDALSIATNQGVDTQVDYTQGNFDWSDLPTAAETANAANYKASGYTFLYQGPPGTGGTAAQTLIETSLADHSPVALEIPVYDPFYDLEGDSDHLSASQIPATPPIGYHEVLVVGYDASGVEIQNSWGAGWGDDGFAWLNWDFVEQYSLGAATLSGLTKPAVTAPSVPQQVVVTEPTSTSAKLTWTAPASSGGAAVTGYEVARDGTDSKGAGSYSRTVSASSDSFIFANLLPGQTYHLTVTAINSQGAGPTATVVVHGAPALPSAPDAVTANAASTTATLAWQAPTQTGGSPITGYKVSRDGKDSKGAGAWSTTVPATKASQNFNFLLQATTYHLSVAAITAVGTGPVATVTVKTGGTSAPQSVRATTSGTSVTVTWAAPATIGGTVTGYFVGRNGKDSTGAGAYTKTVSSTSRSFKFSNLVKGDKYTFTIEAALAYGDGNPASVSITVPK